MCLLMLYQIEIFGVASRLGSMRVITQISDFVRGHKIYMLISDPWSGWNK